MKTLPCPAAGTSLRRAGALLVLAAGADFDGVARPLDGDANGAAAFDIGAFKFVHLTADTDGDGARDTAEIIAGTAPTDPHPYYG